MGIFLPIFGVSEAPVDGKTYGRKNGMWSAISSIIGRWVLDPVVDEDVPAIWDDSATWDDAKTWREV